MAKRKISVRAKKKPAIRSDGGRPIRRDGWSNVITGLGDSTRDKRKSASFSRSGPMDFLECEDLYREDDLAARAVEVIPDEMCREWFELKIEGDKDLSEAMHARMDELGILEKVHEGLCFERAYGGGAIFLGVDDGARGKNALAEPLNVKTVRSVKHLTTLSPRELIAWRWDENVDSENFGHPELYQLQPFNAGPDTLKKFGNFPIIHYTRIVRFQGIMVSRRMLRENAGWGDSIFVRLQEVIADFQAGWAGGAALLQDFSQAVIKIKGLAELIGSNDDGVVVKRLQLIDMTRSLLRAVVMDADGEDFERKSTPMTGYPDMLEKFMIRVAGAVGVPVSLFFGRAPAGLNATGESDIRSFYDHIASTQKRILAPKLKQLIELLFMEREGPAKGAEPENWSIEFNPLYQLDEVQRAEVKLKTAQADQIYLAGSVVTPEEVATSRFGGDAYSTETQIDTTVRREMEPAPVADPNAPKALPPGAPGEEKKPPPAKDA